MSICYNFASKKKMQFILIAYDGTDSDALERRLKVRQEHLTKIEKMKEKGEFIAGGAILDDNGKMTGSMIVYELPDRKTLDDRLRDEPYFTTGVWKQVEIKPFRMAVMKQ